MRAQEPRRTGREDRPPLPPVPAGLRDVARRPSPAPGYAAPGNVFAPLPSRPPSHIPAGQLEDQASVIGRQASDLPGAWPGSGTSTPNGSGFRPGAGLGIVDHPRAASLNGLNTGMQSLSVGEQRRASAGFQSHNSPVADRSPPGRYHSAFSPRSPSGYAEPPLALPVPNIDDLNDQRRVAGQDTVAQVRWARDLLRYVERTVTSTSISDARLVQWIDEAVNIVMHAASTMPPIPEALYLRAELGMSGSFPSLVPRNPKAAFRDFEAAANAEYAQAWYRIGREYESFKDSPRAISAYESGIRVGDATCTYRLAMAYLLGQLDLQTDIPRAVDLLHKSAMIADRYNEPDLAAPLFVWGMVLAGEFEAPGVDPANLPSDPQEAGRWMGKAAFLGHALAQHKMGWANEFAQLGESFDPLRSVQWYSLASQQGDSEADLALSKWFLCGAENYFDRNETLAFTFAEKAASKNLPAGLFAVAYYHETGIGTNKDLEAAKKWYRRAMTLGNADARSRLEALESATAAPISRAQADREINRRLTQRRTQARIASESTARRPQPTHARTASGPVAPPADIQRRNTMRIAEQTAQTGWNRSANRTPQPDRSPGPPGPKRYTLSDTPVGSPGNSTPPKRPAQPPARTASPAPARTASPAPAQVNDVKRGPATFAEMGIPEAKLKKCV